MNGYYVIPRWVEQLAPKERFIYLELLRLAIFHPAGVIHKEYGRHVPQGAWILSYRQLSDLVDLPVPTVHRVIKSLVKKELIEVIELGKIKGRDGNQKRTMFQVRNYQILQAMEHPLEHPMEHPLEHPVEHPPTPDEASDTNGSTHYQNMGWNTERNTEQNTPWNTEWNKKNKGIKNKGFKNEGINNKGIRTNQGRWLQDSEYMHLKKECGWLVHSDDKVYSYFERARKERSAEELQWAWNEYVQEKGNHANLATFLSHEHRNYEKKESRFRNSRFTSV